MTPVPAGFIFSAKRQLVFQSLLCIFVASNSLRAAPADGGGGEDTSRVAKEDQGANVALSIARSCKLGQPMLLSITLCNNGDQIFIYGFNGYLPQCHMALIDRNTKVACELTRNGKGILSSGWTGGGGQHADVRLEKGAEKTWTIDLRKYFVVHQGSFALSLTIRLHRAGLTRAFDAGADDLSFEITQPKE